MTNGAHIASLATPPNAERFLSRGAGMTWPVILRREDSMAFLGVFKQAVKQIRTAGSGEVGSSWFRSQPISLKSINSIPIHAVAQIPVQMEFLVGTPFRFRKLCAGVWPSLLKT
jgi:hypothetical protein